MTDRAPAQPHRKLVFLLQRTLDGSQPDWEAIGHVEALKGALADAQQKMSEESA